MGPLVVEHLPWLSCMINMNFLSSDIFPMFQNDQNTGYLYGTMLIFDRCHRSWAGETPDKYEHGWSHLTYTFVNQNFR